LQVGRVKISRSSIAMAGKGDADAELEWRKLLETGWKRASSKDEEKKTAGLATLAWPELAAARETASSATSSAPSIITAPVAAIPATVVSPQLSGRTPGSLMARLLGSRKPSEDLEADPSDSSKDPLPPSSAAAPSTPPARSNGDDKRHPVEEALPLNSDADADAAWRRHLETLWQRSPDGNGRYKKRTPALATMDALASNGGVEEEMQQDAAETASGDLVEIDDVGDEELLAAEEASAEAALQETLEPDAMPSHVGELEQQEEQQEEQPEEQPEEQQKEPEVVDLEALDDESEQPVSNGSFKGPSPKWSGPKRSGPKHFPKTAPSSSALRTFSVDNTVKENTSGLGFRKSKDLNDKDLGNIASWGSIVQGIDVGDGWLKVPQDVGDRFLPFTVGGKTVLNAKVPLARTTSGTLFGTGSCGRPPSWGSNSQAALIRPAVHRTITKAAAGPPKQAKPPGLAKGVAVPPKHSRPANVTNGAWTGQIRPVGAIRPPHSAGASKRPPGTTMTDQHGPEAKRGRVQQPGPNQISACDADGRPYNLREVVVNFANVGASYGKKVLGKTSSLFDWEGVRLACKHLRLELGMNVIGVIFENFWGSDKGSADRQMPPDITALCASIEETPRLTGMNQKSADDEMTIKCAWRRNCRFMDNDNYRDWKKSLRDEKCRQWLERTQDFLQMRYYFDSHLGSFDTLDGNIPPAILASGLSGQPPNKPPAKQWQPRAVTRPGAPKQWPH